MKNIPLKTLVLSTLLAITPLAITGCTYNYDDENRRIMAEGETYDIVYARVVSATPVTIKEEKYDSGTATTAGVVGGALIGSVVGYNTHHHHVSGYHHGHHYRGYRGSSGGALVGGLIGAGLGLLIGEAVKSANNVKGQRLNLVTSNNENFAVDVPANKDFRSGDYVQVNITKSGYTQVIPITKEAYTLGLNSNQSSSLDAWADEYEKNNVARPSTSSTIEYDDY